LLPNLGVFAQAAALELTNPADDLDGFSGYHDDFDLGQRFLLLFSVDRTSMGGPLPDPNYARVGFQFSVRHQAGLNQAAGDLFAGIDEFQFPPTSPDIPGADGSPNDYLAPQQSDYEQGLADEGAPEGPGTGNNVKVVSHTDCGGPGFVVDPPITCETPNPGMPVDEVDAAGYPSASSAEGPGGPVAGFFSATRKSPSLADLPGVPSGASIFFDPDIQGFGTTVELYVGPGALGLDFFDDVDALLVLDDGNGVFDQGADKVVFSLDPISPSLGGFIGQEGVPTGPFSPADVFVSAGDGTFHLLISHQQLGLRPVDDIDALEVRPLAEDETAATVLVASSHPGKMGTPGCGDGDFDGSVDLTDFAEFTLCFTGSTTPTDDPVCAAAHDCDGDGNIDLTDFAFFQLAFTGPGGGGNSE
jgi:hypothetical protein